MTICMASDQKIGGVPGDNGRVGKTLSLFSVFFANRKVACKTRLIPGYPDQGCGLFCGPATGISRPVTTDNANKSEKPCPTYYQATSTLQKSPARPFAAW